MKSFLISTVLLSILWGCSTTESTVQEPQQVEAEENTEETSAVPQWYRGDITSASDSLYIHGFALASSSDSTEALTLAKETSVQNLRYEIDKITEDVRIGLSEAEPEPEFDNPSFIRELRNGVRMLSLEETDFTYEYEISDKQIFYVYARSSLQKDRLPNLIEDYVSNSRFVEELDR